jgi:hypothetical protein
VCGNSLAWAVTWEHEAKYGREVKEVTWCVLLPGPWDSGLDQVVEGTDLGVPLTASREG